MARMRYHEFDNLRKYRLAKEEGYTTRYQAFDGVDFDHWLADQRYAVTGVDLIQDAIDIAVRMAKARGCAVRYVRDNLTDMTHAYGMFDVVVDSNCPQSIATDRERHRRLFGVPAHTQWPLRAADDQPHDVDLV